MGAGIEDRVGRRLVVLLWWSVCALSLLLIALTLAFHLTTRYDWMWCLLGLGMTLWGRGLRRVDPGGRGRTRRDGRRRPEPDPLAARGARRGGQDARSRAVAADACPDGDRRAVAPGPATGAPTAVSASRSNGWPMSLSRWPHVAIGAAMTIRVLVADDHPLVRSGLQAALAPLPDVEVVAEAATGSAAIREAVLHRPDVVVMDLQMPDLNGIEATRELRRVVPSAAVLVLTMFDDDSVFSAMRAGARGYVLKGAERHEIARAITAVAAGHSNHQIAAALTLSGKTVANHLSAILAKLQVADRTQAILRARDAGLGHP